MTKIPWTQHTWNPVVGCRKVSPGCDHCYAERMAQRLAAMGLRQYQDVLTDGRWNGQVALASNRHWASVPKSGLCFVCSMSDLFHNAQPMRALDNGVGFDGVPYEWIHSVYGAIEDHPKTTFQILTKHPEAVRAFYQWSEQFCGHKNMSLPNIWFGVTCENQELLDLRTEDLLQIPAAVRFVSMEPLLGPAALNLATPCDRNCNEFSYAECPGTAGLCVVQNRLDWVIVGAESGPGRRPCRIEWVRDIVGQCRAAGVPVFIKQLDLPGHTKVVKDVTMFPADLQIQQWPTS